MLSCVIQGSPVGDDEHHPFEQVGRNILKHFGSAHMRTVANQRDRPLAEMKLVELVKAELEVRHVRSDEQE
jgi:hypothetical protein